MKIMPIRLNQSKKYLNLPHNEQINPFSLLGNPVTECAQKIL